MLSFGESAVSKTRNYTSETREAGCVCTAKRNQEWKFILYFVTQAANQASSCLADLQRDGRQAAGLINSVVARRVV